MPTAGGVRVYFFHQQIIHIDNVRRPCVSRRRVGWLGVGSVVAQVHRSPVLHVDAVSGQESNDIPFPASISMMLRIFLLL